MKDRVFQMRTYHVFHVNCDCGSYDTTRQRIHTGSISQMRCDLCRRSLGDMEVHYKGSVRAISEFFALIYADAWRKKAA